MYPCRYACTLTLVGKRVNFVSKHVVLCFASMCKVQSKARAWVLFVDHPGFCQRNVTHDNGGTWPKRAHGPLLAPSLPSSHLGMVGGSASVDLIIGPRLDLLQI